MTWMIWALALAGPAFAGEGVTLRDNPVVEDQAELLPKAPETWRFERLAFPLKFAPDLGYEGFEEIAFAPGMFEAESDGYWTYIFAMKITNPKPFDTAALKAMLETYYRGLCTMVAANQPFDIDASRIVATVEQVDPKFPVYTVRMATFDPFTTGRAVTLNMEITVYTERAGATLLFAAVSPQAKTAAAWTELRVLSAAFNKRQGGT